MRSLAGGLMERPGTFDARKALGLAAFTMLGHLTACSDPVFEPFEDTSTEFSVFGVLDASVDTQWVRIMPIRPSIFTSPEPSDAVVVVENLDSGEQTVFNDSILRFARGGALEDGGVEMWVHNFWVSMDLEPESRYRFTVTRPDGSRAEATVRIPDEYVMYMSYLPRNATVRVEGVEHIAFIQRRSRMPDDCPIRFGYSFPYETFSPSPGVHEADPTGQRSVTPPLCSPLPGGDIFVVASGSPWLPRGFGFVPFAAGIPALPTNLENAVGYLEGVRTKAARWDPCEMDPPGDPCVLTYGREWVTLKGTVVDDPECGGAPVATARMRLTEILEPGIPVRVRTNVTLEDGAYLTEALEPGVPHALQVIHLDSVRNERRLLEPVFHVYHDTLTFAEGEQAAYDIALERNMPCEAWPEEAEG